MPKQTTRPIRGLSSKTTEKTSIATAAPSEQQISKPTPPSNSLKVSEAILFAKRHPIAAERIIPKTMIISIPLPPGKFAKDAAFASFPPFD